MILGTVVCNSLNLPIEFTTPKSQSITTKALSLSREAIQPVAGATTGRRHTTVSNMEEERLCGLTLLDSEL